MRPVVVGRGNGIHSFIGFDSLNGAILLVCPCAESATIQRQHVELCLTVHHPLGHILSNTTLGNTDACTTKIPEISQSSLGACKYVVIRGMRNGSIDNGPNTHLPESWRKRHTALQKRHQPFKISIEQLLVKGPIHTIECPGFRTPHLIRPD